MIPMELRIARPVTFARATWFYRLEAARRIFDLTGRYGCPGNGMIFMHQHGLALISVTEVGVV